MSFCVGKPIEKPLLAMHVVSVNVSCDQSDVSHYADEWAHMCGVIPEQHIHMSKTQWDRLVYPSRGLLLQVNGHCSVVGGMGAANICIQIC